MATNHPSTAQDAVVRVGISTSIRNLDPRDSTYEMVSSFVLSQVFETPFAAHFQSPEPEPLIFDGPLIDDRRGALSAALRSDVRFSDGTSLTVEHARDVLAIALADQVRVGRDGDRLVFEPSTPNQRFASQLTVLPCAIWRQRGEALIGTGPYMIDGQATRDGLRLIRNPYFRRQPDVAVLEFVVFPADEDGRCRALLEAIEKKEIDLTISLTREEVGQVNGYRRHFGEGTSTAFLFFNTRRPWLKNRSARRAIACAIDSLELARDSYSNPLAYRSTGLLPPVFSGYLGEVELADADPMRAREILQTAGIELSREPLKIVSIWPPRPYLPHPQRTANRISEQLRRVGIAAELEPINEAAGFYHRLMSGDYDLLVAGWIADTPDPLDFLAAVLGSDSIPDPNRPERVAANMSCWREPEVDRLLRCLRRDPKGSERSQLLQLLEDEVPLVPLLHGRPTMVLSWDFSLPIASFSGMPYLHTLQRS